VGVKSGCSERSFLSGCVLCLSEWWVGVRVIEKITRKQLRPKIGKSYIDDDDEEKGKLPRTNCMMAT